MDSNTVTLIVAGLGIAGTLGGALIGPLVGTPLAARIAENYEQRKWSRERRYEACITFMTEANKAHRELRDYDDPWDLMEQLRTLEVAMTALTLHGSVPVLRAAAALYEELNRIGEAKIAGIKALPDAKPPVTQESDLPLQFHRDLVAYQSAVRDEFGLWGQSRAAIKRPNPRYRRRV